MTHAFNPHFATGAKPGRRAGACWSLRRLAGSFASLWVVLTSLIVAASTTFAAEDAAPLDFQVKAAFLVNFPKYVDWPSAVFAETNSPITVGIFGDDNVAEEFAKMVEGGRVVGGRPVRIKRITAEDQIGADCQILFIASSEQQRAPAILEKVKGLGILTVGESESFLEKGGIVNLVHRDRKIRFQINLDAARQAHLKISTRLLVVADAVKGKGE